MVILEPLCCAKGGIEVARSKFTREHEPLSYSVDMRNPKSPKGTLKEHASRGRDRSYWAVTHAPGAYRSSTCCEYKHIYIYTYT